MSEMAAPAAVACPCRALPLHPIHWPGAGPEAGDA